jgi:hypothetical protein
MATFNSSTQPSPFGTTSAGLSPNLGPQFFMGCSVVTFDVSADWASQGGSLNVSLLEDTLPNSNLKYDAGAQIWYNNTTAGSYEQRLMDLEIPNYSNASVAGSIPVIGSPQTFKVVDSSLGIIFQYDGVLQEISRNVSPNSGKIYNVKLGSPLSLLQNCSMLLQDFTGFGHAKEGFVNYMSQNQYYQLTSVPTNYSPSYYGSSTTLDVDLTSSLGVVSPTMRTHEIYENGRPSDRAVDGSIEDIGITFGTNNRSVNWADVYNIQNIFGIFENDSDGILNYSRFGGSRNVGGMRFDMICYALHELINNNVTAAPLPTKRRFGGNIIGGTETYNIGGVISGSNNANPYFYGFDILSFYNFMVGAGKITADYIYEGGISSSILDFISKVCDDAGVDFIVELHKVQTTDASDNNYWNGTAVSRYTNSASVYTSFPLLKSYQFSRPGGVISIKTLDRRFAVNLNQPFSSIAYHLLGYEVPDYGDKNLGNINPGDPNPFNPAFEIGAFGPNYLDPLDDDYTGKGTDGSSVDSAFRNTNTSGYGGIFPVETKQHQNTNPVVDRAGLDINNVRSDASQTQVAIRASEAPTAKFVVGGLQSRVVKIPQKYIYQYWGEIRVPRVASPSSYAPKTTQQRSIPVITPILEHNDIVDFIPIDMQDIFPDAGNAWLENVATGGIYMASVAEIRAAMSNKDNWDEFLSVFKPCVRYSLMRGLGVNHQLAVNQLMAIVPIEDPGTDVNSKIISNGIPSHANNTPAANPAKPEIARAKQKYIQRIGPASTSGTKKVKRNRPQYELDGTEVSGKDFEEIFGKIYDKIKTIGDTHYGKSWVGWSPQVTAKVSDDVDNYGQYQHSWKPSNSAYLEPSVWDTFEAPQHNKFMDGGRVVGYANYPAGIVSGTGIIARESSSSDDKQDDTVTTDAGTYSLNFEGASEDSTFQSSYLSQVHTKITVDPEYVFVPYDYFHWYSRDRKPIIIEHNGVTGVYDINYQTGPGQIEYPILKANTSYSIYNGVSYTVPGGGGTENKDAQDNNISTINSYTKFYDSVSYRLTPVPSATDRGDRMEQIMCNDNTNVAKDASKGISNTRLIYDFTNLICPDHGVNCITFTKFTTNRVSLPKLKLTSRAASQTAIKNLLGLFAHANGDDAHLAAVKADIMAGDKYATESPEKDISYLEYFPRIVPPTSVGLPQESTRHRYGPWFTSHNFINGGRVESLVESDLVPENYIFPLYGTLPAAAGSYNLSFTEQLSGFVGMNFAAQAIANSIDGYGQFALEEGSITLPGAPVISRIGDALFTSGPYVTELSIKAGSQGIETVYHFNSATKKAGKTNADVAKQIRKISGKITGK